MLFYNTNTPQKYASLWPNPRRAINLQAWVELRAHVTNALFTHMHRWQMKFNYVFGGNTNPGDPPSVFIVRANHHAHFKIFISEPYWITFIINIPYLNKFIVINRNYSMEWLADCHNWIDFWVAYSLYYN